MTISIVDKKVIEKIIKDSALLLSEHKCQNVVAFDVGEKSSLTDFCVVATVSSGGHLRGVLKYLYEFLYQNGLTPKNNYKKIQNEGWVFIDCGNANFHIMDKTMRDFYELESLWYDSKSIYSS